VTESPRRTWSGPVRRSVTSPAGAASRSRPRMPAAPTRPRPERRPGRHRQHRAHDQRRRPEADQQAGTRQLSTAFTGVSGRWRAASPAPSRRWCPRARPRAAGAPGAAAPPAIAFTSSGLHSRDRSARRSLAAPGVRSRLVARHRARATARSGWLGTGPQCTPARPRRPGPSARPPGRRRGRRRWPPGYPAAARSRGLKPWWWLRRTPNSSSRLGSGTVSLNRNRSSWASGSGYVPRTRSGSGWRPP